MVLWASGDARARARIQAARSVGDELIIPAVALAEVTRDGPSDTGVNRVVNAVGMTPGVDASVARRAGRLLAATGLSATLDALVVASSLVAGATAIMHHDASDLPSLCAAAGLTGWLIK